MGMKKGRILSIPVLAVISLVGYVYYTTVFVLLDQWLGLNSSPGFLNAVIFSFFAFMGLVSFFVSVLTDPGGVPSSFAPDSEDPQKHQGVKSRYCDKCNTYKPPRTHHCRVCKRCVLKMDHHCVWINNCVGYMNYKPFIIFILHVAIGSIYSLVIFTSFIIQKDQDLSIRYPKLFYVICGLIIVIVSLSTTTLLGWHIYLLTHNMSTIEYREAVRAMWLARKCGQKYRHPYDLGVYNNLLLILGPNILKWFYPLALDHLSDGTQFQIAK
ncbi:uncharacterized protein A4U43_C01F6990 [Asparagus officinalis]|uniref:S-acyltransferase n=1 Tax=Asparagus officinalis TaxID=4686 RepID=A0A5P1FS65_ASPOF|nr:probable protein S-acyltransferase 15 [Asparagus officinalis]ONK79500.1 uncharacterized protein A4U43_C01F6990 [Asparagus officinalis]